MPLRAQINSGLTSYFDMHLSHVPQAVLSGVLGPVEMAVVEATEITRDERVYLTTSIGTSPTFPHCAKKWSSKSTVVIHRVSPRWPTSLSQSNRLTANQS